jgi:large repetitive protein
MGSFKGYGRPEVHSRRRSQKTPKRNGLPRIEFLEDRRLLTGGGNTTIPAPLWTPTSTNIFDAQHGPMANMGVSLVQVYQAYVQSGGNTSQLAAKFPAIQFLNGMVGVQVKSLGGDFTQFQSQLENLGLKVNASSEYYGLVTGWAPINELPTIASLPQTMAGQSVYYPHVRGFQGVADNEAQTSMFADAARTQFGVDGTGVTVGVISDSVSQFAGGLADSYGTGDLSSANPVNVIQDDPAGGGTDEGRAMLENIHDVAPGASLAFATGDLSDLGFANNILALANQAGAKLINDDLGVPDDPLFQDGLIAQAINTVTAQGVTYFSAAGNQFNDGYLSTFRPTSTTVAGMSGTFMNFDPNGGTNALLPLTTDGAGAELIFQFDQPFNTQQPAGSTNVVTSNVNIYVIDAATGAIVVGPAANNTNTATQEPLQIVDIPNAGSYLIAFQVISGPNPGHVEFYNINENVDAVPSQQFGSAGGTYYPSSAGHETARNTIGVGATPWWAPAPFLGQNPLANEPFSSWGPGLYVLNADGSPIAGGPVLAQNPSVTAPDGGNTSFFSPGQIIDTSNPPFPGEPATATNLSQNLPTFFGTSSATPNATAVAALMLQKIPQLTPAQIRSALEQGAIPMNGQTQGTWIPQDGFGLVNAINAINAADLLRVSSTNPANGATVTVTPSAITVTFSKAVVFSTIKAGDLTFTSEPTGVMVNVGTPVAVDDPNFPTVVQFPISFTKPAGTLANGAYSFTIQSLASAPPVMSKDGKDLVPSGKISFTLADVTAPVVTATTLSGRTVQIQFSKALDPATVTLSNIFVIRKNGAPVWPPTGNDFSSYVNLNSDPRATISYTTAINPSTGLPTYAVTLNYAGLPQTELPSDQYAIVVLSKNGTASGVTDLVGNSLDGNFTGAFPSGTNGMAENFLQNLGMLALTPPVITTFVMTPTSANDTGIVGDQNTNITQPTFIGQVFAAFPGTVAGLQVYLEFDGIHGGSITLASGAGNRGFTGTFDMVVTTDANGSFSFTAPPLPEGFQHVQAVVVGQADEPPLPGLSSSLEDGFRIDKTAPQITGASFTPGGPLLPLPGSPQPNITAVSSLTSLTLNVVDPVSQSQPVFDTPASILFAAFNPATAANISNYSLVNVTQNNQNESQFIATANFVALNPVLDATGTFVLSYTGQVNLTFLPGLPAGQYVFVAHTTEMQFPGLTDSAGNALDDTTVPGQGTKDFMINFDVQPQPVYITGMALQSTYTSNGSSTIGGEQSFFELPPNGSPNTRDNVAAPPTAVVVDFSNPLPFGDYSNKIQLIQSADTAGSTTDGDFGTLGEGGLGSTGTGFTVLSNYSVTLYNYNAVTQQSSVVGPGGTGNRLVIQLNQGSTLSADDYRVYVPNQLEPGGVDTRIFDIYGNQLDGENLGDQTTASSTDFPSLPNYESLQSDGTSRQNDMSGDGVAGGAFTAGFTVVNYGNVVYARPDYVENPLLPSTLSNGSLANPYPVLAPEGNPNTAPANPNHDPNGGLNSTFFYQPGNFNHAFDFSGDSKFEQSAFYAASQRSFVSAFSAGGPVVVVALAGIPQRNPITGDVTQASFVLQAPAGNNSGVTNGSASVPFNTTLVFAAGATLKSQNASLFVQNQGSALQALGTATNPVTFTSYNDASIGGATNNNPDTHPFAGDWGGLIFRNYDDATPANRVSFPVDGILVGPGGAAAVSGASDVMSILNNVNVRYAGGAVPQGSSEFFSGITLFNSRPSITNSDISLTGGTGGTEAAIGADMDSFREDDSARGPLVRQVHVFQNSLNGIYLMAESNGFIEPTTAVTYPDNPSTLGGVQNYTFFEPLPFIVIAQLIVGQEFIVNSGGQTQFIENRLYIQPGVMMKFNKGSAIDLLTPGSSLNIGSRSYINGFDADNSYGPNSPNFFEESAADPQVLLTTIFDDNATTTLVPTPINVTGESVTPTLTPAMWGGVGIQSGGIAVINAATFTHGGGAINTQQFTIPSQSALAFLTQFSFFNVPGTATTDLGSKVYITNNNFFGNFDSAMQIEPNGLMAGDPLSPLVSGHPFFRGNVMQGNGIDGLGVTTNRTYLDDANFNNYIGPVEGISVSAAYFNQSVDAVWDATDLTYVLRGTLILSGAYSFNFNSGGGFTEAPIPGSTYGPVPGAVVSLTIQAALPGTKLANGESIPSPGQSVIVKMFNDNTPNDAGVATLGTTITGSSGIPGIENAGAGFVIGVDDGVDPPNPLSPLVDPGAFSQLRILGIPGNQTTGQQRVPVIMTSLRDDTVGTTVRGVTMDAIWNSAPVQTFLAGTAGFNTHTPTAGDGGYIYIGGNSLTEYDPTNPLEGSLIDNADISYMHRIEIQGGGIIDSIKLTGTPGAPALTDDWYDQLTGYLRPINQINSAKMFTIENSNLSDFSDAAVFVHPDVANSLYADYTGITNPTVASFPLRGGLVGEPVYLYMHNNTISNSAQGVHINSPQGADTSGQTPYVAVLLNNTFYNNGIAVQSLAPAFNGTNGLANTNMLLMNNIFANSSQIAVNIQAPPGANGAAGQAGESQLQYNLFNGNGTNLVIDTNDLDFGGNFGSVFGDPQFVGPVGSGDAGAQNYELKITSPAVNASRSEIGPLPAGNAIFPTASLSLNGGVVTMIRTDPNALPPNEQPGRDIPFGGFEFVTDSRQLVTLPGSSFFDFPDQWNPVLSTDPNGFSSPNSVPGTYNYTPVTGQRDLLGYIRGPQAGTTGVGFGSNPFEDIGAFQYVNLHPPEVVSVTQTPTAGATPVNFYTVGGISGTNTTPWTINVTFDGPINPDSITADSVKLTDLGSNPAQPLDQDINLAGKLSYDSSTNTLIINLGAAGLTLVTDAYQITLFGSGSPVLTNPQGVALDGENTAGGTATGAQLALPSGNGYPGGNFFDSFIINTTPPAVLGGSLKLDPVSDTNIVGDNITSATSPTFDGTVSEPNPALVPVAGQTAILDVGVAVLVNGVLTTFFDPTQLPSNLASLSQYIRQNAGSGVSTTGGAFQVTVGIDAANTGLVTNTSPLADLQGFYNVGPDGLLSPLPGDDSGYYVARVRVIDQSGNQSNPNDPNAQAAFVVDKTAPTMAFTAPTPNQVFTSLGSSGQISFTVTTSENIDQASFSAGSIKLINAGPDGILGTADDVTVPISASSIDFTLLDKVSGGQGRESISFTSSGTLTNNLYQVTLLNTGSNSVRDIAGNVPSTAVSQEFAVAVPSLAANHFVGGPSFVTSPTAPLGSRENPYPTITAAMTAAAAGDVIAVLPGVYTEQVTMRQFVRLLSADPSSTDSTVFTTSTGDAHQTIIRAPFSASAPAGNYITVSASGLQSFIGLSTEIAGFSIASPLIGDPASGAINPNSIALGITNSNILVDKDYILDAGTGIAVSTSGATALTPILENDGVFGNTVGVSITDGGSTSSSVSPVSLINDDFAFNTIGLALNNSAASPVQAYIASDIFWENHDQTLQRTGFAIFSTNANKANLQNNLFFGNGAGEASQGSAVNTVQNGFSSGALGTTSQAASANGGNFVGNPAFVFPIDPRPGSDGPANFFLDGDFQITAASAAIDNAWEATAVSTDLLGASQVKIAGGGFGLPGYGPRDIGAFEFNGTGGIPVGGAFRVVSTSVVPVTGQFKANGQTVNVPAPPTEITVTFSGNVNPSTVNATDLVLSGTALDTMAPAHATSLTWIDAHTVEFNLTGQVKTSGTLNVSLASGMIKSTQGIGNLGYADNAVLSPAPIAPPITTPPTGTGGGSTGTGTGTGTGTTGTGTSPSPAPAPAPAPHGPLHHKKKVHVVHHPKHVVKHVVVPKTHHKPIAPKHKAVAPKHKVVAPKHNVVAPKHNVATPKKTKKG